MKRFILVSMLFCMKASAQTNTFPSNGPAGIGTTNPTHQLQVVGGGGIMATDAPINAFTSPGAPDPNIDNPALSLLGANGLMSNNGGSYYWRAFWGHSIDLRAGNIPDSVRNVFMIRRYNGGSLWSELFRVGENGNTGIGVSHPEEKLDVGGSVKLSGQLYWDWPGRVIEQYSPDGGISKVIRFRNSMSTLNGNPQGGFDFADPYGNSALRIIDGNVGIGTTDPKGYRLAVNGDAMFTKIKVKQYAGWPDYVFDHNYELPSLHALETFIREKKHLPDMPSADEVHVNGLDVGDTQAKLLKKIEELTLYVIELNKQIEELKNKKSSD